MQWASYRETELMEGIGTSSGMGFYARMYP